MLILDAILGFQGILEAGTGTVIALTLAMTHATIVAVTVYLHRYSAHRALSIKPGLEHVFRLWLWLTTGMSTQAWTAVHRKHHARTETGEDPHSPVHKGLATVLWRGAELYRQAATEETLRRFGHGTPDDWLERSVYGRYRYTGLAAMLIADLALFGPIGLTVWAVQMMWIPFFAAGVVNGVCHHTGYRNFDTDDASRNLVPWGILIGGEELHNNHHACPGSAKLSARWWEIDVGWWWIRAFEGLGLMKVKKLPPKLDTAGTRQEVDGETVLALLTHRFRILARYRERVMEPVCRDEEGRAAVATRRLLIAARKMLKTDPGTTRNEADPTQRRAMAASEAVRIVFEGRSDLRRLWEARAETMEELVTRLARWCAAAECSGVAALREFSLELRTYRCQAWRETQPRAEQTSATAAVG